MLAQAGQEPPMVGLHFGNVISDSAVVEELGTISGYLNALPSFILRYSILSHKHRNQGQRAHSSHLIGEGM